METNRCIYYKHKSLPVLYKFDLFEQIGHRIELRKNITQNPGNWFTRLEYIKRNSNHYIRISKQEYESYFEL